MLKQQTDWESVMFALFFGAIFLLVSACAGAITSFLVR